MKTKVEIIPNFSFRDREVEKINFVVYKVEKGERA